ncbi:predicted protein [Sclerotinia sclerotiorum 1980 UF-70]|uniref:Uncharacterized protein n=2 Tax=Sclerotinia sclerotiorum (strain ATCC 18683 / 1980 / Ss-1) TaxID=665079 RepID=A7ER10_SCLS1|nr:predicted protein [Sclerotinia sclerotiorum 1980 UF-70]APA13586.1 hypothetical protein sscle_11g083560 [Sclerotinia sclerotiorum 1980 UF-70]EDN91902.1 predicted protein [Sclerotinia sclerotiorum 1980 UF-70]
MSPTLSTTFACGHVETTSTRIGTERVPGFKGIIRNLSCGSSPRFVQADSAALCSSCRKGSPSLPPLYTRGKSVKFEKSVQYIDEKEREEVDPDPLRRHPIITDTESEELDDICVDPFANKFAELFKNGAYDFTRKHRDDVDEGLYHREVVPITPVLGPSEPQSPPETECFLPLPMFSFEVAGQPSKVGSIVLAIEKKSKN